LLHHSKTPVLHFSLPTIVPSSVISHPSSRALHGNVPLVQQKDKGHGRRFNHKTNQP